VLSDRLGRGAGVDDAAAVHRDAGEGGSGTLGVHRGLDRFLSAAHPSFHCILWLSECF
jgi:hypothetical protein